MKNLVILGATSGISQAYINRVADRFEKIVLIARDAQKLGQLSSHVSTVSNASVSTIESDLSDSSKHEELISTVVSQVGSIDCALISYGQLTDQNRCVDDVNYAMEQFNLNGASTISLSLHLARQMMIQDGGTMAVIGSVAGDRGRRSNYCYGAAKSAVESFLAGLRSDMQKHKVHVLTVKPGFVDTPMTSEIKKGALWASADKVAADIDSALQKRKNLLYTPWFWRYIMLVIKCIPEFIFKKLPL